MNTENNNKRVDQLVNEKRAYFEELGSQNNAGKFKGLATHSESKGKYFLAIYATAVIGIETLSDWKEPTFIKHIFQPEKGGNSELETRFSNIERAQEMGLLDEYDLRELSTRATVEVLKKELKLPIGSNGLIYGTNFKIDPTHSVSENTERIKDELRSIFGSMPEARQYFRFYHLGKSGYNGYGIEKRGKTYLKFYAQNPLKMFQLVLEGFHKRPVEEREARSIWKSEGGGNSQSHSWYVELSSASLSIEQYSNGDYKLKAPGDVLKFVDERLEEIQQEHRVANASHNGTGADHAGNRHLF